MCAQLSLDERRAMGTKAAAAVPPQAHRGWEPAAGRRSPVEVLAEQEADRLSDLVPVRHGRMMISPFTFYRGAAAMTPLGLGAYARACGWTLARAHARSGDPVAIAAYLGESDEFDRSVTDFAIRYADQNERDYARFVAAIRSGELTAVKGV
jgi:hypothetical protein